MKKAIIPPLLSLLLLLASCTGDGNDGSATDEQKLDTIPMLVKEMQTCSRLYTAEYQVHKVITHDDVMKIDAKILGKKIDLGIPMGDRKIAIPMNATLKAYIDFSDFSEENVRRRGEKLEITLPPPHVVMTSSSIDHSGVRQDVSLLRSNFSDAEMTKYENQGRESIIESIPQLGILNTARSSAATQLIAVITSMGFSEEDIIITFVDSKYEKGGLTWFRD